jgi:hypothetical protein
MSGKLLPTQDSQLGKDLTIRVNYAVQIPYLLNSVSTSLCRGMLRWSATSLRIALNVPTEAVCDRES